MSLYLFLFEFIVTVTVGEMCAQLSRIKAWIVDISAVFNRIYYFIYKFPNERIIQNFALDLSI